MDDRPIGHLETGGDAGIGVGIEPPPRASWLSSSSGDSGQPSPSVSAWVSSLWMAPTLTFVLALI